MSEKYSTILHLPHPVSRRHRPMPTADRAAQFAPFAALTGYEDAIDETARLTDARLHLSEDETEQLDRTMQQILMQMEAHPQITVTYFIPDIKKVGGSYRTLTDHLKRIDSYEKKLIMQSGTVIAAESIVALECHEGM